MSRRLNHTVNLFIDDGFVSRVCGQVYVHAICVEMEACPRREIASGEKGVWPKTGSGGPAISATEMSAVCFSDVTGEVEAKSHQVLLDFAEQGTCCRTTLHKNLLCSLSCACVRLFRPVPEQLQAKALICPSSCTQRAAFRFCSGGGCCSRWFRHFEATFGISEWSVLAVSMPQTVCPV